PKVASNGIRGVRVAGDHVREDLNGLADAARGQFLLQVGERRLVRSDAGPRLGSGRGASRSLPVERRYELDRPQPLLPADVDDLDHVLPRNVQSGIDVDGGLGLPGFSV